jgi:hypothetical protein
MVIYPATTIRNRNTRAAYQRAVWAFSSPGSWSTELVAIEPLLVAAYIQALHYYPQGKRWWGAPARKRRASSKRCRRIICSKTISTPI